MKKVINIFAALPYGNGEPHLGHFFSTFCPADVCARANRKIGYKVNFISGIDAHGINVYIQGKNTNTPCKEIIKKYTEIWKTSLKKMDIPLDVFLSTLKKIHGENVIRKTNSLLKKNIIRTRYAESFMCQKCKIHLPNSLTIYKCYKCNKNISDFELNKHNKVSYICSLCNNEAEKVHQKELILKCQKKKYNLIKKQVLFNKASQNIIHEIEEKKKNETNEKIITRRIEFGIKVPNFKDRVFYVWYEALISYISFSQYNEFIKGKRFFFMGKDNIYFHTVFLGNIYEKNEYPTRINASFFLNYNGKKFSKSEKVGIFLSSLKEEDIPIIRLYFFSIINDNSDSEFKEEEYISFKKNIVISRIYNFFQRINKLFAIKYNNILINMADYKKEIDEFLKQTSIGNIKVGYQIFINYVNNLNKQFNEEKAWEEVNEINANKWYNKAFILNEYIKILSPKISKKIEKFFNFKKNKVYLCKKKIFHLANI